MRFLLTSFILLVLVASHSFAQNGSSMQLGVEAGPIFFSERENISFFMNVEPKIPATERITIGLRIAASVNSQAIQNNEPEQYVLQDEADNGAISFVPTLDYYFSEKPFKPFLGIGVGYYLLAAEIEFLESNTREIIVSDVDNQIGVLIRGGFEKNRFQMGIEYNWLPEGDIELPGGETIGTVDNSYLGIAIGFILGSLN